MLIMYINALNLLLWHGSIQHRKFTCQRNPHLMQSQQTSLGKRKRNWGHPKPRQGRTPGPPFPSTSRDFALSVLTLHGSNQKVWRGFGCQAAGDLPERARRRKVFFPGILLIVNFLAACIAQRPQPMVSMHDRITIDITSQKSTSHFSPGISNVDTSLFDPWEKNDPVAVQSAKSLVKEGLSFLNQYIMGWGTDDPWPDPMQREPYNWSTMDKKMQIALDTGVTPVITLYGAPWWMKGQLQPDGTTKLLTRADDFADIATASRILDNKMDDWLHLVRRIAERYMIAPYNVRYFQVWNELKGYYNPTKNNWDMSILPGNPSGPYAKHGYTYMYNRVYNMLKDVAVAESLDPATIHIGGPYLVMHTWSDPSTESTPSQITKAYGNYDQRDLDALEYWLRHKVGAEFITIDGNNRNQDERNRSDPFTASEKFADVVTWIRSLNRTTYPEVATLPIWWAEWYADANSSSSDDLTAAIKSYAMIKLLKAGGAVAFEWGGTGEGEKNRGLWTPTNTVSGGQPLPWYYAYKAFKTYFGPGISIYKTYSSSNDVEALISPSNAMLVNKTPHVITVAFRNKVVKLNPYQVSIS